MNVKLLIVLGALVLTAAGFYMQYTQKPGIKELRAHPEKFAFEDYRSKEVLHTRLSTLFPRESDKADVDVFFQSGEISYAELEKGECTLTYIYGPARFIFGSDDQKLKAIQVSDGSQKLWPSFTDICPRKKDAPLTPAPGGDNAPIHLPILPLDIVE